MKNAILYYYGLHTTDIYQINKKYSFSIKNKNYVLLPFEGNDIERIYKLSLFTRENGLKTHEIILNKESKLITIINDIPYVLLLTNINSDEVIKMSDLVLFNNTISTYQKNYDLVNLWKEKIDYIEYQMSQFGRKHKLIEKSINYYIGLAETAISLIEYLDSEEIPICVAHNRIKATTTMFDFYNPLNLVLDSRVRDFTEYFKFKFFKDYDIKEELILYFSNSNLSNSEYIIFLARMLFPTYYFDLYEEIIVSDLDENILNKVLVKVDSYQKLLTNIYTYISNYINIPDIEWLKKDVILH